jgi:hypothetical protein
MRGRGLTEEQKVFLVTRLACHEPLAAVLAGFRAEFGEAIDRRKAHHYDASKPYHRRGLGKALCQLFDDTRAAFDREAMTVPIANKIFRLRAYQRYMERAEEMGNLVLAGEMCERAAKEVGGAYTNRREMNGPNGGVKCVLVELPAVAKDADDWVAKYTPREGNAEAHDPSAS